MANLNGPWLLGWVGSKTGCESLTTFDLRTKIKKIYCASPNGTAYITQVPADADDLFAIVKKLECGTGFVIQLTEDSVEIPNIVQGVKSSNLIVPNFPLEITINGLTSDYELGNGTYTITTFFSNQAPTYKNENGWIIEKESVAWKLTSDIVGLKKLVNNSSDPTGNEYVTENCSGNCQTAFPNVPTDDDGDDTATGDATGDTTDETDNNLPEIENLRVLSASDESIKIGWNSFANIKGYVLEVSSSPNFNPSATIDLPSSQVEYTIENLNHSTNYFYRIKYVGYLGAISGPYSTNEAKTTIPGRLSNLTVGVNNEKNPILSWDTPVNVDYEYKICIYRSRTDANYSKIKEISSLENIKQYKDTDVFGDGLFYYMVAFDNGNLGSYSSPVLVKIDSDKPTAPILSSINSPTSAKNLIFYWNQYPTDVTFLYKFNDSAWIRYNVREIVIPAKEGENVFTLKAVGANGSESSEVTKRVVVDYTPPSVPSLNTPLMSNDSRKVNFSWTISDTQDLIGYIYRFNTGEWVTIDKTVNTIEFNTEQGTNTFEIKSVDSVDNKSSVATYSFEVNFQPPNIPILDEVKSPTKAKQLQFKWKSTDDLHQYEYRFYNWNPDEDEPNTSPWTKLNKSFDTFNFTAKEGFNKFEILAVDSFGNKSDSVSRTVFVDHTPPASPDVTELDFYEADEGQFGLRYGWKPHEQYSDEDDYTKIQFKYKFNDGDWVDLSNRDEVTVSANEGVNEFKIYAYDEVGNNSTINTISKMVDTIAPTPPHITGPLGIAPENLNKQLWEYAQLDSVPEQSSVMNISYSFLAEGTPIISEYDNLQSRQPSASATQFKTNLVSTFEFMREVEKAFADWKSIIELSFPSVIVNFVNMGVESSKLSKIPSSRTIGYKDEFKESLNLADIRIGLCKNIQSDTRNMLPTISNGTALGYDDIHLDSRLVWKVDDMVDRNSYSIRFAMRHYIGKSLRLSDNTVDTHGTMAAIVPGKNIVNTTSSDTAHFYKTYSFPFLRDKQIRVVKNSDLKVTWENTSSSLYEWKCVSISETGRVLTNPRWKLHHGGLAKQAEQTIDPNSDDIVSNNIRFYIRSVDISGNTSNANYLDIKLISEPSALDLVSVSESCETNPEFTTRDNCWDKFGMFSADIIVDHGTLDMQAILVEIHNIGNSFRRYELIDEIETGEFTINSLESDTTYNFRVALVNYGKDLSSVSPKSETSLVGTVVGEFSETKQLTTKSSHIKNPDSVVLSTPTHFRHQNENEENFVYPVGESVSAGSWKPTANVNWTKATKDEFAYYELQYSKNSLGTISAKPTKIKITDIDQVNQLVRFDEYDTTYYLMLIVKDAHGNASMSSIVSYKTVPQDKPPQLTSDLKVNETGELGIEYDERPGTKWTLAFNFPDSLDSQYPSKHRVPDIEDFSRKDYSLTDWLALLGHPPLKLESETWIKDKTDGFVLWLTRDKILDENFDETDYKWEIDESTKKPMIKISGFEANQEYRFKYTVYDSVGHYVAKTIKYKTRLIPNANTPVPHKPSLGVSKYRYLNGHSRTGVSLSEYQWKLSFSIKIKNSPHLSKFYMYEKSSDDSEFTRKTIELNDISLKKLVDAGFTTYTVAYSGYNPRTKYEFKVDAVNKQGRLSEQSNIVNFVTPVGDTKKPMPPKITSFERKELGGKDKFIFKLLEPDEPNLTLMMYYTINTKSTDFWSYEHKTFISPSNLHFDYHYSSPTTLSEGRTYRVAFMWRDSAYNYSFPVWRNTNPNASSASIGYVFDNVNLKDDVNQDGAEMIPALHT